MSLDGRVSIDLVCEGGAVQQAVVTPPPPVELGPIVKGRPIADVVAAIGSLFSVCGMAQSAAGVEAAEAAMGIDAGRRTREARRLLVLAETLREHLLMIGLDHARLAGQPPDMKSLRRAMTLVPRLKHALFRYGDAFTPGSRVCMFGPEANEIAAEATALAHIMIHAGKAPLGDMDRYAFAAWAGGESTIAARLVTPILARDWAMAGCPKEPMGDFHEGRLADTSCLARQGGEPLVRAFLSENGAAGLVARLAARFVEASRLPGQIAEGLAALQAARDGDDLAVPCQGSADAIGDRSGTGSAEAARGRVEHRVVLCDGRVADYAIAAPTSSHFAADGVAARSLAALAAATREDLATQADLLIRAIDPCVGYDVRFC